MRIKLNSREIEDLEKELEQLQTNFTSRTNVSNQRSFLCEDQAIKPVAKESVINLEGDFQDAQEELIEQKPKPQKIKIGD